MNPVQAERASGSVPKRRAARVFGSVEGDVAVVWDTSQSSHRVLRQEPVDTSQQVDTTRDERVYEIPVVVKLVEPRISRARY